MMTTCNVCGYDYDGNFCPNCGSMNPKSIQQYTQNPALASQNPAPPAQEPAPVSQISNPETSEPPKKEHKGIGLFGFRTNKFWKKLLSIFYIIFCLILFIDLFNVSKFVHLSFRDIVVDKLGDLVFFFSAIAPYIFLSNTKFRNKLPLFKNHRASLSFIGMLIVWTICIVVGSSVANFHSEEYEFDKENHSFVVIETVNPSCTDVGKTKKECTVCDTIVVDEVPALGHDFSDGEKCVLCQKTKAELTKTETTKTEKVEKTKKVEKATKKKTDPKYNFFDSEKLNESFIAACKECNIDIDKVKQVERTEDWAAGPKYCFYYNYELYTVYCTMDEQVKSINIDSVKIYENTKEAQPSKGKYRMVYDQKGETGKEIILDGNSYYNYFVPTGTYKVTNRSKTSMFYIASDRYYTNSDGYQENDILKTITISEYMGTTTIEISEGHHIELVVGADIELEKIG